MPSVVVVGAYPLEDASEPCHLVEIEVTDAPAFNPADITQEDPEQQQYWQAPYLERVLSQDGSHVIAEGMLTRVAGTTRLAFFFHHLDPERPLLTPFGPVPVPTPTARPERLSGIEYEPVD